MEKTRRRLLQGIAATGFAVGTGTMNAARAQGTQPDLVLRNGQFTTLDRSNPQANAVAIKDGRFVAVGQEREVMALAGSGSKVIDLKGRRAIPGLIDSHTHIIRGGLNYNMELRWDGVHSLADAMTMLKRQIAVTPPPQWVRVVGGFTERQFAEKRLPTIEELNAVAPDTPVFILHLYDRALLNGAALRVVGYTKDTPIPLAVRSSRTLSAIPPGCCWRNQPQRFCTRRWPKVRSYPRNTRSIQPGISCASSIALV